MTEPSFSERASFIHEDYVHSANSLFHFVRALDYLISALQRKALCPRYCVEDIRYLKLVVNNERFDEVAVLQKCFCDIPLPNVFKLFPIKLTGNNNDLTEKQISLIPNKCSHPELYGNYAIGLSKVWGEQSGLQPVQYMIEDTSGLDDFSSSLGAAAREESFPDIIVDSMINRICFMKPIRGAMKRRYDGKEPFEYEIFKNFHDEHEWRYVPSKNDTIPVDNLIANIGFSGDQDLLRQMSDKLEEDRFKDVWLPFRYSDIRYLIVPDDEGRVELINSIIGLNEVLFEGEKIDLQKQILISKILVINEITKDL